MSSAGSDGERDSRVEYARGLVLLKLVKYREAEAAAMKTHRAGVALARQAVLSPYVTVREAAAKRLRERSPEQYAPVLLSALETPISARFGLYVGREGVRLTRALYRETADSRDLLVLDSAAKFVPVSNGGSVAADGLNRLSGEQSLRAAARDAQLRTRTLLSRLELSNDATDELNERVCTALRSATSLDLQSNPRLWWEWWMDYNELYGDDDKPSRDRYVPEYTRVRVPQVVRVPSSGRSSCLAAGTSIWTDRGPAPVETIKIGDLVLARDPETAELAYKPVLRTTVRPPTELIKVTAGGDTFLATGGHSFWISGRGWLKIRDAQPGMRFHGATEPVEIETIEPAGSEPTYNLVVADFHTYFVGPNLVFSHDPTFARPTDVKVPGLR